MKNKTKFIIYALVLIFIKQVLVSRLPIYAIGGSSCDDLLMINLETNILQLKWLGDFNSLTLVKGMIFPLFLAINQVLGISYINATSLLYSFSCVIFVYSIKDLFNKKYPLYIIFSILLFNPVMFSTDVMQRVYRNSLTPSQVLLIFSSIFYIFINRNNEKKRLLLWNIFLGINLFCFWNTREDAIWILPLIVVFLLIIIIEYILKNKKSIKLRKILMYIFPFIILFIGNNCISMINYMKYGTYTRVDVSKSSFASAMKAIYSVPTNKKIEYTSVTREKLERLYNVSPSLNKISKDIDKHINEIDKYGRIDDGEIEDGWFWWVLRFAAEDNGYYKDAKTADKFFSNIVSEIKLAQENNLIEKQSTMPSALMSPWKKGYGKKLFNTVIDIIKFTNSFENVNANTYESLGSDNQIRLFEIATNDTAIRPNYNYKIKGWYLYNESNYYINVIDINTKEIYNRINCSNNKVCNIELDLSNIDNLNNVGLDIYNINNDSIELLLLKNDLSNDSNDVRSYNIYDYSTINPTKYQKKVSGIHVVKLNIISNIYKRFGVILSFVGLICYSIISFIFIFKNHKLIEKWLVLTSILLSYLVLCIGVGYNEISSCSSISVLYLCAAYPLIIMFYSMNILILIDNIKSSKFLE